MNSPCFELCARLSEHLGVESHVARYEGLHQKPWDGRQREAVHIREVGHRVELRRALVGQIDQEESGAMHKGNRRGE